MIRTNAEDGSVQLSNPDFLFKRCPISLNISAEEKDRTLGRYHVPKLPPGVLATPFDNYQDGDKLKDYLVIIDEMEITPSKSQPYLKFRCTNASGSFSAKKWGNEQNPAEETMAYIQENPVLLVSGDVQEYPKGSGRKSFVMKSFIPQTEHISPNALLPTTPHNLEDLTLEFFHYLYELDNPYRDLALSIMDTYWEEFSTRGAATGFHHNFIGGLLQHTTELLRIDRYLLQNSDLEKELSSLILTVTKFHLLQLMDERKHEKQNAYKWMPWSGKIDHLIQCSDEIINNMQEEQLDGNKIIFGHILHDIGKVLELANVGEKNKFALMLPYAVDANEYAPFKGAISYDDLGSLFGHMPASFLIFHQALQNKEPIFTKKEITDISHIILSHHGKVEWNSTVPPKTSNAWFVHFVDYVDANYVRVPKR